MHQENACRPKVRSGFGGTTCIRKMHVAQKCAAVWENDMHRDKDSKRVADALWLRLASTLPISGASFLDKGLDLP
ncbi:hypothetical protein [Mesorhizobium sp.]|uniref:hypothetical protein n=1 Tax=Mesorhizobium sp. TaxID=1871066 RepID=UPI000FE5CC5A|nr:hypothetical protein [Mesorhizobium sp.]RWB52188.1 MAG: hypothetical protein EOQ47_27040 [Mesorhizobium sp.]